MKHSNFFYTRKNRTDAIAWWDTLSEEDKVMYTEEYNTANNINLTWRILTGREIQNIWAVKSNETDEDRQISKLIAYYSQCESIKVIQIPLDSLDFRIVQAISEYGKLTFKDTDNELQENIYSVGVFETLEELNMFPKGHECYTEVKALDQVCRDMVYSYIQITTI